MPAYLLACGDATAVAHGVLPGMATHSTQHTPSATSSDVSLMSASHATEWDCTGCEGETERPVAGAPRLGAPSHTRLQLSDVGASASDANSADDWKSEAYRSCPLQRLLMAAGWPSQPACQRPTDDCTPCGADRWRFNCAAMLRAWAQRRVRTADSVSRDRPGTASLVHAPVTGSPDAGPGHQAEPA